MALNHILQKVLIYSKVQLWNLWQGNASGYLSFRGVETLFKRYRNPSKDLDRSQELKVLYDSQEAKLQTSVMVIISC